MNIDIITKDDLSEVKVEIIEEVKRLLNSSHSQEEFLRSKDVMELLKVSSGTLQTLRIKGILSYKKLNGTLYYKRSEIEKLLQ